MHHRVAVLVVPECLLLVLFIQDVRLEAGHTTCYAL